MEKRMRRALLALLLVALVLVLGSLVAQADPAPQGVDPYFNTHLGPVAEKPVTATPALPGAEGDLLDWSGVDWQAWLRGLESNPIWALVVAVALGITVTFSERWGVPDRLKSAATWFNVGWDRLRQNKAGWWATEIPRRMFLPWVGVFLWIAKQVVAIPGAVNALLSWLVRGTVENFKTVVAFVRADNQGKAEIIEDEVNQFRSGWEIAKALPGLLWDDVKTRWSRGWNGLVRMWTDPNVTNEELLQWGADHASMVADASVVASAVGVATRVVKGASWFRELSVFGRAQEVTTLAKAAQLAGHSKVTTSAMLRVLRSAEEEIKFSEMVVKLSAAEQDSAAFLLRKGVLELQGDSLRFSPNFTYSGNMYYGNLAALPDVMPPVEARYQVLVHGAPGYNITPMSTIRRYSAIGRDGTFLTDARAVEEIIGPIPPNAKRIRIVSAQARRLEQSVGLRRGSLERENMLSIVEDLTKRTPGRPTRGNEYFRGVGKGLDGGGPEVLVVSIPSEGGPAIRQIVLEVID